MSYRISLYLLRKKLIIEINDILSVNDSVDNMLFVSYDF